MPHVHTTNYSPLAIDSVYPSSLFANEVQNVQNSDCSQLSGEQDAIIVPTINIDLRTAASSSSDQNDFRFSELQTRHVGTFPAPFETPQSPTMHTVTAPYSSPTPPHPHPHPPTPPPPPPPAHARLPCHLAPAPVVGPPGLTQYLDQYEDLLDRIDNRKESLRSARDDLLGHRFRLATSRRELQNTLQNTVGRVGGAFDATRRYFLTKGLDVPDELSAVWSEVDNIRDQLGEQVAEFAKEEEDYNHEEWAYSNLEEKFIMDLNDTSSLPDIEPWKPVASTYGHETDDLTRFSHHDTISNFPENSGDHTTLSDIMILRNDPHLVERHATAIVRNEDRGSGMEGTTIVGHAHLTHEPSIDPSQHQMIPDSVHSRVRWSETQRLINDWMLQILKDSPLQQTRLQTLVPKGNLSRGDWLQVVERHWNHIDTDAADFHTGNTDVSSTSMSEAQSSEQRQKYLNLSEMDDPKLGAASGPTLLPTERVVDALEMFDYSTKIKRRDLGDIPKRVTFLVRSASALSGSTTATTMTSTSHSSGVYASSISTMGEEGLSCDSSGSDETICDGHPSSRDSATTHFATQRQLAPSPIASTHSDSMRQLQGSYHAVFTNDEPVSKNDNETSQAGSMSRDRLTSPSDHDVISVEPLRETQHNPDFPTARLQTRYPFAPFISVKSPKPWSLPLLRLTPGPSPSRSGPQDKLYISHLENIPFVCVSDTPSHLPGPSRFPRTASADLYN